MNFLDGSAISPTADLPVKAGSLVHLQSLSVEGFNASIQALIGPTYDPTKMYILFGCGNTGSGSNYIIGAGAVFFNGQYYIVPAATFTISGSNVAVGIITTSYLTGVTADPVTFTDNVQRNVHKQIRVVFQAGLSGSGSANYANLVLISSNIPQLNLTGTGIATVSGTYPNKVINVPAISNGILAKGGPIAVGDVSGSVDVTVTFADVGTSNFLVIINITSGSGTPANDSTLGYATRDNANTQFIVNFREITGVVQDFSFNWAIIAL